MCLQVLFIYCSKSKNQIILKIKGPGSKWNISSMLYNWDISGPEPSKCKKQTIRLEISNKDSHKKIVLSVNGTMATHRM